MTSNSWAIYLSYIYYGITFLRILAFCILKNISVCKLHIYIHSHVLIIPKVLKAFTEVNEYESKPSFLLQTKILVNCIFCKQH